MKKILVVGGGEYQVPLIKRIIELGHEAYCVDYNPKSPGFDIATKSAVVDVLDKDACLEYARENGIDAVMTFGATLPLPTVAYIGEKLGLPTITPEAALISLNKYTIKQNLDIAGCNIKWNYYKITKDNNLADFEFVKPCVIKPCDGSGSKGVVIVKKPSAFTPAIEYALSCARYGEVYCEERIQGNEYSVEAFANGDDVQVYVIVKTTFERHGDDNESIEYGHRTPAGVKEETAEEIKAEARKAVKALGITKGSVNFDIIVSESDGKPYIIDVGVRVGQNLIYSHLIPLSRGINVLDNTIKQALGEEIATEPTKREFIATRLLIFNPGTIKEIKPYEHLIGKNGIIDIVLKKGVGDVQAVYKDKSDTCGWVICAGRSPEEAETLASQAREEIKNYFVIE